MARCGVEHLHEVASMTAAAMSPFFRRDLLRGRAELSVNAMRGGRSLGAGMRCFN